MIFINFANWKTFPRWYYLYQFQVKLLLADKIRIALIILILGRVRLLALRVIQFQRLFENNWVRLATIGRPVHDLWVLRELRLQIRFLYQLQQLRATQYGAAGLSYGWAAHAWSDAKSRSWEYMTFLEGWKSFITLPWWFTLFMTVAAVMLNLFLNSNLLLLVVYYVCTTYLRGFIGLFILKWLIRMRIHWRDSPIF